MPVSQRRNEVEESDDITKTCPCNILRFFPKAKIEHLIAFFFIFLINLLKTLIVGTR